MNTILILDNCSAHNIDFLTISKHLTVKFLPPNITSRSQPADMGMINSLKLGYKSNYLRTLLRIFDTDGGYEAQAHLRAQQPSGCKGIVCGENHTVLDCMIMLKEIGMEKVIST